MISKCLKNLMNFNHCLFRNNQSVTHTVTDRWMDGRENSIPSRHKHCLQGVQLELVWKRSFYNISNNTFTKTQVSIIAGKFFHCVKLFLQLVVDKLFYAPTLYPQFTELVKNTGGQEEELPVTKHLVIWAPTWQNQQNECVPSKDSDQPVHLPSLISLRCPHEESCGP